MAIPLELSAYRNCLQTPAQQPPQCGADVWKLGAHGILYSFCKALRFVFTNWDVIVFGCRVWGGGFLLCLFLFFVFFFVLFWFFFIFTFWRGLGRASEKYMQLEELAGGRHTGRTEGAQTALVTPSVGSLRENGDLLPCP